MDLGGQRNSTEKVVSARRAPTSCGRKTARVNLQASPRPHAQIQLARPNCGARHLHWKDDLLRLELLPLLPHFKQSQHLQQFMCDGVGCTLKYLTAVSSFLSQKDTRLDKPQWSQNTAVGVPKKQQRDLAKDHQTTDCENQCKKKNRSAPLMQPLIAVNPVQKEEDHQTHSLLQWPRLTLAGPNTVNRKASPTGGGTPKQASQVPHHTATLVRPE